jgi:uncharacterized protein (DUF488 family)
LGIKVSHEQLFTRYETEILPDQGEARKRLIELIAAYPRVALICFEAEARLCHRYTLVEYLHKGNDIKKPVVHL